MSSSNTNRVWRAFAVAGVMALVGCSSAPRYEGASPSFRSVSGYQDAKYSYVGLNFNFAAPEASEYHHPAVSEPMSTATASAAE